MKNGWLVSEHKLGRQELRSGCSTRQWEKLHWRHSPVTFFVNQHANSVRVDFVCTTYTAWSLAITPSSHSEGLQKRARSPWWALGADYMVNFSPCWNFRAITWRISARVQCLKLGGKRLQENGLHLQLKGEIGQSHVIGPLGTVIRSCNGQSFISIVFIGEEWEIQTRSVVKHLRVLVV